jgi:hypothetical protein|tara:strand:- start:5946 stop:6176 length:231 start_codon:yes stop_codon:yes gene_type:complete
VPKYHVTGGPTGDASIEIAGKTYNVGESFEAPSKDLKWLIDDGYIKAGAPAKTSSKKQPEPEEPEAEEPESEKDGD